MLYDIAHFWVALLVAVVLGIGVGWFTWSEEPRHGPILRLGSGWIFWGAIFFLVGLVLALVHLIPNRPGLWLETALLIFVAYLLGCPIPGLFRTTSAVQPTRARVRPDTAPLRAEPVTRGRRVPEITAGGVDGAETPVRTAFPIVADKSEARPVASPVSPEASRGAKADHDGSASPPASGSSGRTTGIISDDPDAVDQPKSP